MSTHRVQRWATVAAAPYRFQFDAAGARYLLVDLTCPPAPTGGGALAGYVIVGVGTPTRDAGDVSLPLQAGEWTAKGGELRQIDLGACDDRVVTVTGAGAFAGIFAADCEPFADAADYVPQA